MFEKTLTDVVKGIRASKRDTALYISQCIAEIKVEINSTDPYVKANALQKITFLQMMGYSMSWASFASIEVMSFPRFAHKRIGYLAASQAFTQDTDVILLTTNLFKKELRGAVGGSMKGVYEAGLAINCLSNIVTEDLARDLLPEVTNLTKHPQPYLRKKAVLCLFKLFVKYPQGLRLTFDNIQKCLDDSHASVVSCAVNVVTELSDKNPKNYLHLAPAFFQLLTSSSNNWMLIKVVKLLGSLVQEEPRLARKLLEPLANIVKSTQAKSLLYEAIHTITLSLPYCRKSDGTMPPSVPGIITLCAQTLREFVEDDDQNLKYLGLVGFGSLMASHPKVLSAPDYRPLILACLSDQDVTIRTRALDLLGGMASRKNLRELVTQLVQHVKLATGEYKNDLVAKIVQMCCSEKYALLQDFSWFLDILLELGHERGIHVHASLLSNQVTNVALRVLPVRAYAVQRGMQVLQEGEKRALLGRNDNNNESDQFGLEEKSGGFAEDNGRGKHVMPEILPAVAWIVGEYSDYIGEVKDVSLSSNSKGFYHGTIQALVAPGNTQKLPTTTQSVYVQAAMKVFAAATGNDQVTTHELEACVEILGTYLPLYMQSTDVEVKERAFTSHQLLKGLDILVAGGLFGPDLPNLTLVAKDDDDSSQDEGVVEDDLLGVGTATITKQPKKSAKEPKKKSALVVSGSSVIASRCREASSTLQYLLKPEPMKPISAKSQKKKHQSPIGISVEELEAPVDWSAFSQLLEEERSQRPGGDGRISIESVSFTQQRPLRAVRSEPASGVSLESPEMPRGAINGTGGQLPVDSGGTFSSSFQRTGGTAQGEAGAVNQQLNRPSQHDPFYLDAGGDAANVLAGTRESTGFGTIQLLDSDADDEDETNRQKKRKQKKKERKRRQKNADNNSAIQIGEDDFAMLSMKNTTQQQTPSAAVDYTVYSSDDDDKAHGMDSMVGRGKGGSNKEFAGLAKVDLTTPLREDEVMPKREHRVVPERPPPEAQRVSSSGHKKKKKKKASSKRSKKKGSSFQGGDATAAETGDLLDLGGFTSMAAPPVVSSEPSTGIMQNTSTPISTAFDDLLGLTSVPSAASAGTPISDAPAPDPPRAGFESLGGFSSQTQSSAVAASQKGKRPWLKCNVKTSSSSRGSAVDWEKVSLYSKAYMQSDGQAAMVKIRVTNRTEDKVIGSVSIRLKGLDDGEDVEMGTLAPGGTAESSKVGPIPYDAEQGDNKDIRGSVVVDGESVSFKLTLPVLLGLCPAHGMTQDAVMSELSSGLWSSHSVTLRAASQFDTQKAKSAVGSWLQAAEIPGENGVVDPMSGTFAATLKGTSIQVRALIKVKPSSSSVKVDLKSTDAGLSKSLASCLKRIEF